MVLHITNRNSDCDIPMQRKLFPQKKLTIIYKPDYIHADIPHTRVPPGGKARDIFNIEIPMAGRTLQG